MRLYTAGLVVIKDRKLLLAFSKNKRAFYLPGGKIDAGETATSALVREIKEELNIELKTESLHYYMHITAPAYGELNGIIMEQDCYRYEITETPQPNAEIGALDYFDSLVYSLQPVQVPGVVTLINQLKSESLIS
jgi:8-oxo-dGTP pyrophosphatase MutT (NUDIX family)